VQQEAKCRLTARQPVTVASRLVLFAASFVLQLRSAVDGSCTRVFANPRDPLLHSSGT
jgi:hypothetical protein